VQVAGSIFEFVSCLEQGSISQARLPAIRSVSHQVPHEVGALARFSQAVGVSGLALHASDRTTTSASTMGAVPVVGEPGHHEGAPHSMIPAAAPVQLPQASALDLNLKVDLSTKPAQGVRPTGSLSAQANLPQTMLNDLHDVGQLAVNAMTGSGALIRADPAQSIAVDQRSMPPLGVHGQSWTLSGQNGKQLPM
jgi:hypothetical protein